MRSNSKSVWAVSLLVWVAGCEPKETKPPEKPPLAPLAKSPGDSDADASASKVNELPVRHPPIHPPTQEASNQRLDAPPNRFDGLSLTPPDGWIALQPKASGGAMSFTPQAAFELPKADGDPEDASVRLTHFPGMRNIPIEAQLQRWHGQFAPSEAAVTESFEIEGVKVTVTDISGTMQGGAMGGEAAGKSNYRMIAAIIEHPQGPHFVKVIGPVQTVAKWKDSVFAYLHSAKIVPE